MLPLYGDLPLPEQDKAIRRDPQGRRKIILATSIAETSLTIDGVRVVVDSGLRRSPRFDPTSGMSRLVTVKASLAAAAQRRGRAGRTEPGVCYRLWSAASERALACRSMRRRSRPPTWRRWRWSWRRGASPIPRR